MSTPSLFIAVFMGSKSSPRLAEWGALPAAEQQARAQKGMAAWHAWAEQHQAVIADLGGPLGKTKRISQQGIEDASNDVTGFTIVRAESHEAAAKLFENHPHFTLFPGDCVEVMPVMPVPGM
jgi:hypothetical protein